MPKAPGGFKYLLVFVDIFTGWRKAFPCRTERANKVTKALNIKLTLHSAWRPQCPGKTEGANRTLKNTPGKTVRGNTGKLVKGTTNRSH